MDTWPCHVPKSSERQLVQQERQEQQEWVESKTVEHPAVVQSAK